MSGRLVLVIGPSGAGKDTVIEAARAALAGDPGVQFPRRIVTRPASAAEDNVAVDPQTFARMAADGAFALSWHAHGHDYGVPAAIRLALAEGRTVVVNVSRTAIPAARALGVAVTVVEITAPPELLAARIAGRARASDGDAAGRLSRVVDPGLVDVTIVNDGPIPDARDALLVVLRQPAPATSRS